MTRATAALAVSPDQPFVLADIDLQDPRQGEILVRVAATGICHTDLSVRSQATPFPLPAVLGHEGAGVVEAVGPGVTTLAPGDRVSLSFSSCGACGACAAGSPVYCAHWIPLNLLGGSRLDGSNPIAGEHDGKPVRGHFFGQSSMATYALATERAAVKIPDELPFELAAPLGCAIQTGVASVLNVARPAAGSSVVVYGAGGVGLSAIMACALTPASTIVAVDIAPNRLDLARELGATHTVRADSQDVAAAIADATGGGPDVTVETTGRPDVLKQAVHGLRSRGTCVVIGAPALGTEVGLHVPDVLGRGLRLVGTNQGDANPRDFLPRLMRLHVAGKLPYDRLVQTFPLENVNEAVDAMRAGTAIKPVLTTG